MRSLAEKRTVSVNNDSIEVLPLRRTTCKTIAGALVSQERVLAGIQVSIVLPQKTRFVCVPPDEGHNLLHLTIGEQVYFYRRNLHWKDCLTPVRVPCLTKPALTVCF